MAGRKGLLIALSGVLAWLLGGSIIYFLIGNCSTIPRFQSDGSVADYYQCPWTFPQSFYFSVQTGLSIGFGLLAESHDASMAYSIIHILLGSSVIAGALGLFASLAVTRGSSFQSDEEKKLAKASSEMVSNAYSTGFKGHELRDLMVKYPHYARVIVRKMYKHDAASASKKIEEFEAADAGKRKELAKEILKEASENLDEFKDQAVSISEIEKLDKLHSSLVHRMTLAIKDKRDFWAAAGVFSFWIALGTIFSVTADESNFITGLYFAVSTCSTAGMVSVKTVDSQLHVLFTAFYALVGVPLYGLFLGFFANILVDRYNNKQVAETLHSKFSKAEVEFLEHMSTHDHKSEVDLAEYIEFQLLRLGNVDRSLLSDLQQQFKKLDKEGTGYVKKEAFLHALPMKQQEVTV